MEITRRWVWGLAIGLVSVFATGSLAFGHAIHGRWDIIKVEDLGLSSGGQASAMAENACRISFTGSGTFVTRGPGEKSSAVTGGGTWKTAGTVGVCDGIGVDGTYSVTGLIRFEPAPGSLLLELDDRVGNREDARAGLLALRIAYSDGSHGILVISSRLEGTPYTEGMFEGVTATKGFVAFWVPVEPSNWPFVATLFHIRDHGQDHDHDDDGDGHD